MAAKIRPPVTVRLVSWSGSLTLIAAAARVTVSRKDLYEALKGLDVGVWMAELLSRSHGSPLEHAVYSFEATCSRVCSHQLVRHRLASYTQQSMRVTDGFLRSTVLELCSLLGSACPSKPRKPEHYTVYANTVLKALEALEEGRMVDGIVYSVSTGFTLNPFHPLRRHVEHAKAYLQSLYTYYALLAEGEAMEEARYVLPQAVRTRIVFTMNARELAEVFIPLRTCMRAQWEIRLLAWMVRDLLQKLHPELYRYTGPRCVLQDARVRGTLCTLAEYVEGTCKPVVQRCPEKLPSAAILACLKATYTQYRRYIEAYPDAMQLKPIGGGEGCGR